MAKKATNKPSKAEAIRKFQNENPGATPSVVSEALKKEGYKDMTPQYVSTIKSMDKKKAEGGGKNGEITAEDLMATKEFVRSLGGLARAKNAVEMLSRLTD